MEKAGFWNWHSGGIKRVNWDLFWWLTSSVTCHARGFIWLVFFQSTWTNSVTVYRWRRQSIHHLPQVPHPTGSAIQTRLYLGFHRLPQVHKNLGHILPNAMVTSNKNVHNFWHHFLAQFSYALSHDMIGFDPSVSHRNHFLSSGISPTASLSKSLSI